VSYFTALKISRGERKSTKRIWVILCLIIIVSLLGFFKLYPNQINIQAFGSKNNNTVLGILVPIGISFYTFQTIGYVVDVYKGRIKAEKSLLLFSSFVSFFPLVLAGPIERAKNLLPQLRSIHISSENIYSGFKFFLWGFFKKVLVADKLSILANPIFNDPNSFSSFEVIIGVIFYSFQIYCDFSGYCDMGLGIANAIGIDLSINFYHPYNASSLRDFWQRWHISLMKWLRTYIYIPLGGSKRSRPRWVLNLFFVFILSGLWHGTTITFIIWACLHFTAYLLERIIYKNPSFEAKIPLIIRQLVVFLFICITWVFFRSQSTDTAFLIIRKMFTYESPIQFLNVSQGLLVYGNELKINTVQLVSILLPFITYLIFEYSGLTYRYQNNPKKGEVSYSEIIFTSLVLVYSILFITGPSQQFIYFKF
jgi:D-alanyl-lipoteichoic acid acyltransferase DltB (MBOAT superfamily)